MCTLLKAVKQKYLSHSFSWRCSVDTYLRMDLKQRCSNFSHHSQMGGAKSICRQYQACSTERQCLIWPCGRSGPALIWLQGKGYMADPDVAAWEEWSVAQSWSSWGWGGRGCGPAPIQPCWGEKGEERNMAQPQPNCGNLAEKKVGSINCHCSPCHQISQPGQSPADWMSRFQGPHLAHGLGVEQL